MDILVPFTHMDRNEEAIYPLGETPVEKGIGKLHLLPNPEGIGFRT